MWKLQQKETVLCLYMSLTGADLPLFVTVTHVVVFVCGRPLMNSKTETLSPQQKPTAPLVKLLEQPVWIRQFCLVSQSEALYRLQRQGRLVF